MRAHLARVGAVAVVAGVGYEEWRSRELKELRSKAQILLRQGTLLLDSPCTSAQKREGWETHLRPTMIAHWTLTFPGFDYKYPETWPQPENGKERKLSNTFNKVPGLPRLTSDDYFLQAVVAYMLDPKLRGRVHYGEQTHIKLQFLINPLFVLCGGVSKYRSLVHSLVGGAGEVQSIELQGSDQSWHLVNIANKHAAGRAGQVLPSSSHIDGGEDGAYVRAGLPAVFPSPAVSNDAQPSAAAAAALNLEERLLLTLVHQLAILFHCETPGPLLAENGATAFLPQSHLSLVLGLKDAAHGGTTLSWATHTAAIRNLGREPEAEAAMLPLELPEGRSLLAFGLTVHAQTWALETMGSEIRVIQNAKIKASKATRSSHEAQRQLIAALPKDCLLRVVARANPEEWKRELGLTDEELALAQVLGSKYASLAKKEMMNSSGVCL